MNLKEINNHLGLDILRVQEGSPVTVITSPLIKRGAVFLGTIKVGGSSQYKAIVRFPNTTLLSHLEFRELSFTDTSPVLCPDCEGDGDSCETCNGTGLVKMLVSV